MSCARLARGHCSLGTARDGGNVMNRPLAYRQRSQRGAGLAQLAIPGAVREMARRCRLAEAPETTQDKEFLMKSDARPNPPMDIL